MKTTQGNMLLSLRNVQGFLQSNASQLAAVVATGVNTRLNAAITALTGHATDQTETLIQAKGSTRTQLSLRTSLLRYHMAPINRIAKLELGNTPELQPFLMPKGTPTLERLKALADGMSKAAAKYTDTFVAAGLPADFIPQMDSVSTEMVQAQSVRSQTTGRRKGATTSLRTLFTNARKIVHVIDTFVHKAAPNDPGLLSNWNLVKRVPKTGGRSAAPAAPATPAASTPAAAQQSHTPTT